MSDKPGTAIERLIDYYKWTYVYDWEFHQHCRELDAKMKAVLTGEKTYEEAFGHSIPAGGVHEYFEKKFGRQMPYRIRLPKHWHWMGPDWSPRLTDTRHSASIPQPPEKDLDNG